MMQQIRNHIRGPEERKAFVLQERRELTARVARIASDSRESRIEESAFLLAALFALSNPLRKERRRERRRLTKDDDGNGPERFFLPNTGLHSMLASLSLKEDQLSPLFRFSRKSLSPPRVLNRKRRGPASEMSEGKASSSNKERIAPTKDLTRE
ncbi:hypothetical protein RND71_015912 [Anisodus tanguticus]|uniref:Uncharacterized protein n=1 Tax=Anisodus tanguticus TaxID=243964 RepID=A0AAE1VKT4_9SOLA|nr:hypothetical protein RND71_015912 [Anisodus tanguticus]